MLQITSSYVAETLTPQGKQLPSFVINTGFKQEFLNRKLVVIATISDVFNSLKNRTIIDTPELFEKDYQKEKCQNYLCRCNLYIWQPEEEKRDRV